MNIQKMALSVLERMERREAELLAWGIVDGFHSEDDYEGLVQGCVERCLEDGGDEDDLEDGVEEVLEFLEQRGLVHQFGHPRTRESCYRSRLAESVRLISKVRQLWPRHVRDGARLWETAPTLVADFRFSLRPRAYPSRSVESQTVVQEAKAKAELNRFGVDALRALLPETLSKFQLDSTLRILEQVHKYPNVASGTIISAGTGSGKTFAFYIPALTYLASLVDSRFWTRAIAIYPRNELLKDQFSEAFGLVRKLDPVLAQAGKRKLRIGALFGDAPDSHNDYVFKYAGNKWRYNSGSNGYACPYFNCPAENCSGKMVWRDEDRRAQLERLVCGHCRFEVGEDEVVLTRNRMQKEPPDLLFATTEMLNQRLGDSYMNPLFGVGKPFSQRPKLMLLDEVHLHEGKSGAQVALLLRRWRLAVKATPHFVGLSATLRNAKEFFARLVDVPAHYVGDIEAVNDQLEGMEYLLALRGDPASPTSLLSTTIEDREEEELFFVPLYLPESDYHR